MVLIACIFWCFSILFVDLDFLNMFITIMMGIWMCGAPRNIIKNLVGINADYTKGDRIIAWSVFYFSIVCKFGICFLVVFIWNLISPWPNLWLGAYFFITYILVGLVIGVVTTVWFMIGGLIDARRLFRDLAARIDSPLDDGRVEGGVSVMDHNAFHESDDDEQGHETESRSTNL